jgi:hypothetical protein
MPDQDVSHMERRCPRLGSDISFHYCLISGEDDGPCFKILDCWWEYFDVTDYLRRNMPEAAFAELILKAEKPKNKIGSIIDIIRKVQKTP